MRKKIFLIPIILLFVNCEVIFVENISNATVNILAPTQGSIVDKGVINFNWDTLENADAYHLQVATPTFTNASQIVLDTIILNTSFSKELTTGNFQWRVNALNTDYQTNYTTTTFEVK